MTMTEFHHTPKKRGRPFGVFGVRKRQEQLTQLAQNRGSGSDKSMP